MIDDLPLDVLNHVARYLAPELSLLLFLNQRIWNTFRNDQEIRRIAALHLRRTPEGRAILRSLIDAEGHRFPILARHMPFILSRSVQQTTQKYL